ncbi:hypothetical protein CCACVL1_30325 [Corchorus capsularis]|uniref:Uncharacterized protein n=1 Tax=Corchorus capsularis TaxID=210143 RepID=A0A1R3FXT4_COCAP|nr:hypothetical protein CCACVL1_30325 [Corchorus capsularis]
MEIASARVIPLLLICNILGSFGSRFIRISGHSGYLSFEFWIIWVTSHLGLESSGLRVIRVSDSSGTGSGGFGSFAFFVQIRLGRRVLGFRSGFDSSKWKEVPS